MGKSTLVLPGTSSLGIPDELYLCGWACFFPNSSNYNWDIYVFIYICITVCIYIRVHDWWVWVKYPNFRMVSDNGHDVNIDNTVWWSFPALGCENSTYMGRVCIWLFYCIFVKTEFPGRKNSQIYTLPTGLKFWWWFHCLRKRLYGQ